MPISISTGAITAEKTLHSPDGQTSGATHSNDFAVCAPDDVTKQLRLDPSGLPANTAVTLAASSSTASSITVTLPSSAGAMGLAGSGDPAKRFWSLQSWFSATTAGTDDWTNTAAGTASDCALHSATSTMYGAVSLVTGTDTGGRVAVHTGNACVQFGGAMWTICGKVLLSAASSGAETYTAVFGFSDSATDPAFTDGVAICHNSDISPNWYLRTASNGTETNTISTIAATTAVTSLRIVVNAAGTSASFYINDVLGGTATTNIPSTAGRQCGQLVGIYKADGTTSRTMTVGPVFMEVDYS